VLLPGYGTPAAVGYQGSHRKGRTTNPYQAIPRSSTTAHNADSSSAVVHKARSKVCPEDAIQEAGITCESSPKIYTSCKDSGGFPEGLRTPHPRNLPTLQGHARDIALGPQYFRPYPAEDLDHRDQT
jgi:hypothetical protein